MAMILLIFVRTGLTLEVIAMFLLIFVWSGLTSLIYT